MVTVEKETKLQYFFAVAFAVGCCGVVESFELEKADEGQFTTVMAERLLSMRDAVSLQVPRDVPREQQQSAIGTKR